MFWDVILSLSALLAALIAIRGNTWDKQGPSFFKRMTWIGWTAAGLALIACVSTITKASKEAREAAARENRLTERIYLVDKQIKENAKGAEAEAAKRTKVAANQVLADLAPQMQFYKLMLQNKKLPTTDFGIDAVGKFADFLEAKLNRYRNELPTDVMDAGEQALTKQRQLHIRLTLSSDTKMDETAIRKQMQECLDSGKAFGNKVLMLIGNDAGMDRTIILSTGD